MNALLDPIVRLLDRCDSAASVMPPTELYNEDWMLRLVVDWFDRHRNLPHPFAFAEGARWYTEACLPSPFLPTSRPDPLAESFAHADGVVGHFAVQNGVRGDAALEPGAKQFVVIEAKLGSGLSAGTKNVPAYDQAARNVACMAHMLSAAEVDPASLDSLGFYVVAPLAQISAGVFGSLVSKGSIRAKVAQRVAAYEGLHANWFRNKFLPTLDRLDLQVLSWEEDILDFLPGGQESQALRAFYASCLQFNLPGAQDVS